MRAITGRLLLAGLVAVATGVNGVDLNKGHHIASFCSYFKDGRALESIISTEGGPRQFYTKFHDKFDHPVLDVFIKNLPEVNRREVQREIADVCAHEEGLFVHKTEASDMSLEQRRERHENSQQQGKTGIFVVMFRFVLDWIYGADFLEKAAREGRERRRILDRLRELGHREVPPDEVQALIERLSKREKPYAGAPFDPFTATEWPDTKVAPLVNEFSGVEGYDLAAPSKV